MCTDILFITDNKESYDILKNIVKMFDAFECVWAVDKYNDERHVISLHDVDTTQVEVIEWVEAIENILRYMGELDKETPYKYRGRLNYSMLCNSVDDDDHGISYEIERRQGKLTIKESPSYLLVDGYDFDGYDDFCAEYGALCNEDEFRSDCDIYIVGDKVCFEEPDYGSAIPLSEFIKQKR